MGNFQLEEMDVQRQKVFGRTCYLTKEEINGNTYVVYFGPPGDELNGFKDVIFVEVWATPDGDDEPLPDHPTDLGSTYHSDPHKLRADFSMKVYKYNQWNKDFATVLTQTINEAVCELEDKQSEEQSFADAVNAALEANKEVHEGIDYELEKEKETD